MTYSQLKAALSTLCDKVYEIEAKSGETKYILLNTYGVDTLIADNSVQMEALKVQIDVFYQNPDDTLLASVKAKLSELYIPYSVQDGGVWDDEYMAFRAILQCEVL